MIDDCMNKMKKYNKKNHLQALSDSGILFKRNRCFQNARIHSDAIVSGNPVIIIMVIFKCYFSGELIALS